MYRTNGTYGTDGFYRSYRSYKSYQQMDIQPVRSGCRPVRMFFYPMNSPSSRSW